MQGSKLALAALLLCTPCLYAEGLHISHAPEQQSTVAINTDKQLILLPIQDKADEVDVNLMANGEIISEAPMRIRLAREQVDYYAPLDIAGLQGKDISIQISGISPEAACWQHIQVTDQFEPNLSEPFRPLYHHAPPYGWMNDPNGMFYQDGVYHLYFQFNPWGNRWGNLSWGHSTTTDFVHWDFKGAVLKPDALGRIFSGSSFVDEKNVAGFGAGAVLAYYTSAGSQGEIQSMAYSLDKGQSFTKYHGNPILTGPGGDFRDPKVFYHEASKQHIMVLTIGRGVAFYSSAKLIDWMPLSEFGEAQGCHDGIWECPDFFPLTAPDGSEKWVLLSNISNGSPMGGSGTQYFIGNFDGKSFTNLSAPQHTKWMNYGRDHYATVTWANAPDKRAIAIAWMTNSHYTDDLPTKYFRGSNTIARDLFLFEEAGELYLGNRPTQEMEQARVPAKEMAAACEISFTITPKEGATSEQFCLQNKEGEQFKFTINFKTRQLTLDRSQSGTVNFYGGFLSTISGPIYGEGYDFRIFLDKNSVECFVNGGRSVFSNLAFPSSPYTEIKLNSDQITISPTTIYHYP